MVDLDDGAPTFGADEPEPPYGHPGGGKSLGEQPLPSTGGKGGKVFPRHLDPEVAGPEPGGLTGRGR